MENGRDEVIQACFDLSVALMWEKDRLNSQNVHEHIDELNEMTEQFVSIATGLEELLDGLHNKRDILVSAIKYLHDAHAIPPLRGNFDWFKDSLMTLIEILNPNSSIRKSNLVFIQYLQQGLNTLKGMAVEDEDLDF